MKPKWGLVYFARFDSLNIRSQIKNLVFVQKAYYTYDNLKSSSDLLSFDPDPHSKSEYKLKYLFKFNRGL